MPRHFAAPWSIEESLEAFIVKDAGGQALAYLYFENEAQRRLSTKRLRGTRRSFGREHRQAAERDAADIEGHSAAGKFSQPGRLSASVRLNE